MEGEETVVIIPAFNEAEWLPKTLSLLGECLRKARLQAKVVVVDDGSTDGTAEAAAALGVEVVSMPKNVGKANAVYAGVKKAVEYGAASTLLLDADILHLPTHVITGMAGKARDAARKGKTLMVICPWLEQGEGCPTVLSSGIRAFSNPALHKIKSSRLKGAVTGFGLEPFLNRLFRGQTEVLEAEDIPIGRKAFHSQKARRRQRAEVSHAREALKRRRGKLRN